MAGGHHRFDLSSLLTEIFPHYASQLQAYTRAQSKSFSKSRNKHSAAMAPKAEKKPAKKVAKKVAGGKGKKGKSKVESFKIYIYKVLKQVSISKKGPTTHST